jgi:hypothetical protein
MSIVDTFFNRMAEALAPKISDKMGREQSILATYYVGNHRPQLKPKENPKTGAITDDNVIMNFTGLAVDRSVSRLFRGGIDFNLPDGAEAQEEYIERVWDLNKKEIILYQAGLHGAVYGTTYFKIAPDGITDPYTGDVYPRLIPIDPEIIRIITDPQDMNVVAKYHIEYKVKIQEAEFVVKEVAYREITERRGNGWVITYEKQEGQSSKWQKYMPDTVWDYDFPPILHWKNLPSLKSCYGDSEIDDIINVQDKANFTYSNTGKIIEYHAHPKTIVTGISASSIVTLDTGPTAMHVFSTPDAKAYNLEMDSDLASSRNFGNDLRQAIFDISREVDISSMADKLGALTNFGLRVLWSDAMDKNDTKRSLYGDALLELNRRLLVLAGWTGEASDPGEIQWGEAMITNPMEEMQVDQLALDMGLVDKETVYDRYKARYGKSWEDIQAALAEEAANANQNNSDIGSIILRNFNNGMGGGEQGPTGGAPINMERSMGTAGPLPKGMNGNNAE